MYTNLTNLRIPGVYHELFSSLSVLLFRESGLEQPTMLTLRTLSLYAFSPKWFQKQINLEGVGMKKGKKTHLSEVFPGPPL